MIARVRTGVLITLIAIAVWVYAEQESLTEVRETARISLDADARRDELALIKPTDFTGEVQVELRGAQAAVQEARERLSELLKISPEQAGLVGREDGRYSIDLRDVIALHDAVSASGVEVVSVRPATVTYEVIRLEPVNLEIIADLGELELQGLPAVTPSTVTVTIPARLKDEVADAHVTAVIDPDDLVGLQPGEQVERQARQLVLPDALRGPDGRVIPGVRPLGVQRAIVSFIVRVTSAQTVIPSVPIEISAPASAHERYSFAIAPETVANVTARGPQEVIDRITEGGTPLIGVAEVVLADVREGEQMQLAFTWMIRMDGVLREALPMGVVVESDTTTVTVDVTRRDEAE